MSCFGQITNRVATVLKIREIREKSAEMKMIRAVREKSENSDRWYEPKFPPLLSFNLMISVSAKMPYQEARENYLRLGRSQGKVRENEGRKKLPP